MAKIFVEKEPEKLKNVKLNSKEWKILNDFIQCKNSRIIWLIIDWLIY